MSDYNIDHYSTQELLNIFNIDIPSKANIKHKIDQYSKQIKHKEEQEFIHNAEEKLLNWINKPLINSNSHSVMINRESTDFVKTKEMDDVADPILLNPLYRNILTRTVNIDSGFRSNSLPKENETRIAYDSKNLKYNQNNSKKYTKNCLLNKNSSTNFVATFSDKLNNILSIQLINYTIPYTWYNIDIQYFNNQFLTYTNINSLKSLNISLSSGYYTLNGKNNIYDNINKQLLINLDTSKQIIFSYDELTSKTNIDIYQEYTSKNNFYYHFIWFDKTTLNSRSNNTLGYKLGFRHFELIINNDIEYNKSTAPKKLSRTPMIYLQLKPSRYTPLLQEPIMLKQQIINPYNKLYYDISGYIYYNSNDITLYMTDKSLQRFKITYKREPIYYLYDNSPELTQWFNAGTLFNPSNIKTVTKELSVKWTAISGEHLTPQNIIRTYPDVSFEIKPYIYGNYISDSIADLTLTKYLLLGIDDFQNNRINNGLISIEPGESYINIKKLDTTQLKVSNCEYSNESTYVKQYTNKVDNQLQTTTTAELKTINALEQNKVQMNYKSVSPTINIFAVLKIPQDNTLNWGQLITNDNIFDNQYTRNYFGPVSLNSFKVSLYTEDGYILNLNDRNWNFSIYCKQLYKY